MKHLRRKIFFQFLSSWILMPLALIVAHFSGIAQSPEFVASVLIISSAAPIQVYINEVFCPIGIRHNQKLRIQSVFEISLVLLALMLFLVYRLNMSLLSSILVIVFSQGYVWFSYLSSRYVLQHQLDLTGSNGLWQSFLIGAVIPLTFLILILVYWALLRAGITIIHFLFLLILLPNAMQYFYVRNMANKKSCATAVYKTNSIENRFIGLVLFLLTGLMAGISQHWKVSLSENAYGFGAVSVYLISPFSSLLLIHSRSSYMAKSNVPISVKVFWASPCLVVLTFFFNADTFLWSFPLALVTQVLTFKFITDIRLKFSGQFR